MRCLPNRSEILAILERVRNQILDGASAWSALAFGEATVVPIHREALGIDPVLRVNAF